MTPPVPVLIASARRLEARYKATLTAAVGLTLANVDKVTPLLNTNMPLIWHGYMKYAQGIGAMLTMASFFWLAGQRKQDTKPAATSVVDNSQGDGNASSTT